MIKKLIDKIRMVKMTKVTNGEALRCILDGVPIYTPSKLFVGCGAVYDGYLFRDGYLYWFVWSEDRKQYDGFAKSLKSLNTFAAVIMESDWYVRKSTSNKYEVASLIR